MLQSILLAVECRRVDDAAVDAAVRLATTFGSKLTLLHVVEATHPAIQLSRMQDAESFLRKVESRLAEVQVPVVWSVVKMGAPAQTIVEIAQEVNADLIVIGAGD